MMPKLSSLTANTLERNTDNNGINTEESHRLQKLCLAVFIFSKYMWQFFNPIHLRDPS